MMSEDKSALFIFNISRKKSWQVLKTDMVALGKRDCRQKVLEFDIIYFK